MLLWVDEFFRSSVAARAQIIGYFKVFYYLLVAIILLGGLSIYSRNQFFLPFYNWGIWCGRIALVLYCITLVPGMTKRFGIQHKLISIIRIYRRYIGISVFLFALTHASFVRLILFLPQTITLQGPLFVTFGLLSLLMLFCMFLTSNDLSQTRLGIWWYRLHWLTHIIMITVFLHTFLQRMSIWSVLIGIFVLAQLASFAVSYSRKTV